jgi:hypothetical protein
MENPWLSRVETRISPQVRQISPLAQEINILPKVGPWL